MANTSVLYARIDTDLKANAEEILQKLGITPTSAIQMLYSQIVLTQSMPLSLRLPPNPPIAMGSLTREELDKEIAKGMESVKNGKGYTADEVDEDSFNQGLKQTLNINTPMFQNDTENLSQSQIEMLKAISNGETKLSSEDVKRRYSLGNPNTITKNKLALVRRDILDNDKGILTFVDPLYRIWLRGGN